MKKYYWLFLAIASMLVACSKDSESIGDSTLISKGNTPVAAQQPITFGAYVNRATTRAGMVGPLTTSTGTDNLQTKGFGVIAYYTDDDQYSPIYAPNFMYNTQVTYNSSAWEYSPVRYWPNETGDNAVSEGVDRLSFFAYAPYVDVITNTGLVTDDDTSGIVGLSRNGAVGDPFVKYYVDLDPSKQVDFCWGVDDDGKPNLNMTKQAVNDKVNFNFNHALAALNVQIDALVNELTPGSNTLDANTKIYVRSVTFEGFVTKGSFNLNTSKATWYDLAGMNYIDGGSVTVYDGRTNGKEGQSESVNEASTGLNDDIIQNTTATAGVTNVAANLFKDDTDETTPIYVIPSGQPLSVTIVYDVETATDELATYLSDGVTHGTSVENKITKAITFDNGTTVTNKLEAGKKYCITLHLGMTSVKFDAKVAGWDENINSGSGNLPENTMRLGTMSITNGGLDLTSLAMWKGETMTTAPIVTVVDENNNPISVVVEWTSSDTNVATVDGDGIVTPVAPGTAIITAKATKDDKTTSKSYTVYVNELTGISITSIATNIAVGGTLPVKATLEINGGQGVNGDITNNLPEVTWVSSVSDKISVTSPINAVKEGDAYVSTTTATAETPAVIGNQAVITASVGGFSDTVTLTCTNSKTVTGVTLGTSTTTVWRCEGYTVPTVTVQGTEDSDLTSLATVTWKVNGNPVTVTNGVIPLTAASALTVTVTASYNNSEASANVTVYANEVTGISVAPASANVLKDATTTLTATLIKTNYGTVANLTDPTVSWSSGSTSYVTVSPATGTSTTASGVAAGSSTVTATVDANYKPSGADNSASCTVKCVTPSATAFRGYEVSTGILERTKVGDADATYSLTSGAMVKNATNGEYSLPAGCNPFELQAKYYKQNSSIEKYYLKWIDQLRNELGADGDNIDADSPKLPTGWTMPTGKSETPDTGEWATILFGSPKSEISVNGNPVTSNAFALVSVVLTDQNDFEVSAGTYYGMLLLRDGTTIPSGYLTKVGVGSQYSDNTLDEDQFNELVKLGCLYVSVSGSYHVFETQKEWRDSNGFGGYWVSTYKADYNICTAYYMRFEILGSQQSSWYRISSSTYGYRYYRPVRLIKQVFD